MVAYLKSQFKQDKVFSKIKMEYNLQPHPLLSSYFDVKIATIDEPKNIKVLEAHKIILASHSEFFHKIFEIEKNNSNFVCHIDIPCKTMEDILELIYNKHVIVNQEDLESFRKALKKLGVKVMSNSYNPNTRKCKEEPLRHERDVNVQNVQTVLNPIQKPKTDLKPILKTEIDLNPIPQPETYPNNLSEKVSNTRDLKSIRTFEKQSRKTEAKQSTLEEIVKKKKFKSDIEPEKDKKVNFKKDSISETTLDEQYLEDIQFELNPNKGKKLSCKKCSFKAQSTFQASNHFNDNHRTKFEGKEEIIEAKDFQQQCDKFLKHSLRDDQFEKNKEEVMEYVDKIKRTLLILKGLPDGKLTFNLKSHKENLINWFEKKCKDINDKIK